jgi:hypothetical protein
MEPSRKVPYVVLKFGHHRPSRPLILAATTDKTSKSRVLKLVVAVQVELPKDRAKLVQAGRVQFKIFTMENNSCGQYRDGCCFCFCA